MLKKGIHAVTCGLLMSLICIVVLAAGAGPSAIPVWSWVCGSGHAAIAAEVAGWEIGPGRDADQLDARRLRCTAGSARGGGQCTIAS